MPTIPDLTNWTAPLTGAERAALEFVGTGTRDGPISDIAKLAELFSAMDLSLLPDKADAAGTYFTTQGEGEPFGVWFPPTTSLVAGYGYVFPVTGGGAISTRGVVQATPTRVYEVEAEVEQVSVGGGESPVFRVGMRSLKLDYTATDGTPTVVSAISAVQTAGLVTTLRARFAASAVTGVAAWADPSTAILLRPYVEVGLKSDLTGNVTNSICRVRRLIVRDVTPLVLARAIAATMRTGTDAELFATAKSIMDSMAPVAVAFAAPLTIDLSGGFRFDIGVLTSDFALANPSGGMTPGRPVEFRFQQDATGGRKITSFGNQYVAPGGVASMALSVGANAVDIVSAYVRTATEIELRGIDRDVKA